MADHDIKIDHGGLSVLRPITAVCGTAPGTVTRRATVTADVFGETYEAEFAIEPGKTVTLPSPVADDTGTWRKVEYPRPSDPVEKPDDRSELRSLEWLALNGYPVGRGSDGRVMASYREEDAEPDWCTTWTDAARKLGMP